MGVMPNGPDGMNPDAQFGVSDTGISELPSRTQVNVVAILKAQKFPAGSVWKNPGGVLKQGWSMVMSALSGAATNAVNALTMLGTLIWKVGGSIIDDVGDFINAAVSNASTALTNAATNLAHLGRLWSSIVNSWFGWSGDWTDTDAESAMANQAATIAAMSSAVTQLQNRAQNAAVGGVSTFIDFTERAAATSLGADFTQTYSGSGTGYLGLDNGAKFFFGSAAPADCDFVKNDFQTSTDYQKIGFAFGSTPQYDAQGHSSSNEIHGRKNAAGDTYVFGNLDYNTAQLGCVVAGVRTVFVTSSSGVFKFKSNASYWLECGTIGGLRVFRILENNTPVLTHTEVGTTSQVGAGYRYTGGRVHAYAQSFPAWNLPIGRMVAMAVSDNYPSAVTGSGAVMFRTTTSNVSASSGSNLFPSSFFNNTGAASGDITVDVTNGKFTVTESSHYLIEAQVSQPGGSTTVTATLGSGWPSVSLWAWVNGAPVRRMGADSAARMSSVNTGGGTATHLFPTCVSGSIAMWLDAGDEVQLGYDAGISRSGVFTGDAAGAETNFSITRVGAKNG